MTTPGYATRVHEPGDGVDCEGSVNQIDAEPPRYDVEQPTLARLSPVEFVSGRALGPMSHGNRLGIVSPRSRMERASGNEREVAMPNRQSRWPP